jgi:hypothetical protein
MIVVFTAMDSSLSFFAFVIALYGSEKGSARMPLTAIWSFWIRFIILFLNLYSFDLFGFVVGVSTHFVAN